MLVRAAVTGLITVISLGVAAVGVVILVGAAADRLANLLARSARRWPAWFRDDRGAYTKQAARFWGLGLVSLGLFFPMIAISYLVDKAKAGQMHSILSIPALLLIVTIIGVGVSSRAYQNSHPTAVSYGQPAALVGSLVVFGVFVGIAYLAEALGLE